MSPRAIQDIEGFKFYFFSLENNEPPHVHVKKGEGSAKWWLLPEPELVYSIGFKAGDERKINALIKKHGNEILQAWHNHFNR